MLFIPVDTQRTLELLPRNNLHFIHTRQRRPAKVTIPWAGGPFTLVAPPHEPGDYGVWEVRPQWQSVLASLKHVTNTACQKDYLVATLPRSIWNSEMNMCDRQSKIYIAMQVLVMQCATAFVYICGRHVHKKCSSSRISTKKWFWKIYITYGSINTTGIVLYHGPL